MYYSYILLLIIFMTNSLHSMLSTHRQVRAASAHQPRGTYSHSTHIHKNIVPYDEQRDKLYIMAQAKTHQTALSSYPEDKDPLYNEWFLEEIEKSLNESLYKIYLIDNKPVGFISYTLCLPWYLKYLPFKGQPIAHIHYLSIDNQHQKKGLGKQLLKAAIQDCTKHKASKVILRTTDSGNKSLNTFYTNQGFTIARTSKYSPTLEWVKKLDYKPAMTQKE